METIITFEKIKNFSKLIKAKKLKIVLVGGVFDIVHIGHVEFLKRAKKEGNVLVVLLESDQNVELRKGKGKPVNSQKDRARVLVGLKAVDYVVCLPFMKSDRDYDQVIQALEPEVIATTAGDPGIEHKKRTAKLVGAELKIVTKLLEGYSTGEIIQKIRRLPD